MSKSTGSEEEKTRLLNDELLTCANGSGTGEQQQQHRTSNLSWSNNYGTSANRDITQSTDSNLQHSANLRRRDAAGSSGSTGIGKRWWSIRVMYFTTFISSLTYTICVSSVWPYLQQIDNDANISYLGWVVAAYSLGQLIANPTVSVAATCVKGVKLPLSVTILVNIGGNLLYSYLPYFAAHTNGYARHIMLVSRILVGVGSGNIGLIRSYVAQATTISERTTAMAYVAATQCLGFVLGPAFQSALTPLGYPGYHLKLIDLDVDVYTSAGLLSVLLTIINLVVLLVFFTEYNLNVSSQGTRKTAANDNISQSSTANKVTRECAEQNNDSMKGSIHDDEINTLQNGINVQSDDVHVKVNVPPAASDQTQQSLPKQALIACNLMFFLTMFVFTVMETISTPFSMIMYDWGRTQAITNNGIMFTILGIEAFCVLIAVRLLSTRVHERKLLLSAFIVMFIGYIIMLPWGNEYPNFEMTRIDGSVAKNTSDITVSTSSATVFTTVSGDNVGTIDPRGCPTADRWCWYTPKIHLGQFFASNGMVGFGYPAAQVSILTLYSKILGARNQNLAMGIISSLGSLARTLGPIFVSNIFDSLGARWTFAIIAGIMLTAVVYILATYRKLTYRVQS